MTHRVLMAGATGKTGSAVVRDIADEADIEVVGAVGRESAGRPLGPQIGAGHALDIPVYGDIFQAIDALEPDVLVDFTNGEAAAAHAGAAIETGVHPVVGATGMDAARRQHLIETAERRQLSGAFIANFSLGAALLQRFARQAAAVFDDVEIVERHHDTKLDRPSGTALTLVDDLKAAAGPEGGEIPVHSLRLPGYVAHHEIVFGGLGEVVTLQHDSTSRQCFAPGVLVTIRSLPQLSGIVTTLEAVLQSSSQAAPAGA